MCPYEYYTIMRQSKDPKFLRLRLVQHALTHSVKDAARVFKTTVNTARKWVRRFDGTMASLTEQSRAPHRRPRKLDIRAERKIVALKKRLPRFSARRLKYEFDLAWSEKAMRRIFRERCLARRYRRKKHQTKRYLREVKKKWRPFLSWPDRRLIPNGLACCRNGL